MRCSLASYDQGADRAHRPTRGHAPFPPNYVTYDWRGLRPQKYIRSWAVCTLRRASVKDVLLSNWQDLRNTWRRTRRHPRRVGIASPATSAFRRRAGHPRCSISSAGSIRIARSLLPLPVTCSRRAPRWSGARVEVKADRFCHAEGRDKRYLALRRALPGLRARVRACRLREQELGWALGRIDRGAVCGSFGLGTALIGFRTAPHR